MVHKSAGHFITIDKDFVSAMYTCSYNRTCESSCRNQSNVTSVC
jgi:hypothetical protein